MLGDLIQDLVDARTPKEKEKAFRNLERVGMDRMTARILANEKRKEQKDERNNES